MACPATGAETAPSLRRVCSGKGSVVHGLLLEYSDGVRTGSVAREPDVSKPGLALDGSLSTLASSLPEDAGEQTSQWV